MPSNDLKNVLLDEISLVDDPANEHARVVMHKRKGYDMTDEQRRKISELMDKGMSEKDAMAEVMRGDARKSAGASGETDDSQGKGSDMDVEKLAAQVDDLKKQVSELTAERDEAVAKLADVTKKADEEFVEFNGSKIAKSAVPAEVLDAIEKGNKRLEEMEKRAEEADLRKRGEAELPHLTGDPLVKGKLLKAAAEIEGADAILKGADAAAKAAELTKEVGFMAHGGDENSVEAKLDKMAKDYASQHNVGYYVAYDEVTKSGEGAQLFAKRNQH